MNKLTKKLLSENTSMYFKAEKIGNAKQTLEYLKTHFGIETLEQLENAQNDCLVIEKHGNIYYNNSRC